MDLTDGKFGVPLPRLETKSDNIKETEKMSSQFLEDQLKDCSVWKILPSWEFAEIQVLGEKNFKGCKKRRKNGDSRNL